MSKRLEIVDDDNSLFCCVSSSFQYVVIYRVKRILNSLFCHTDISFLCFHVLTFIVNLLWNDHKVSEKLWAQHKIFFFIISGSWIFSHHSQTHKGHNFLFFNRIYFSSDHNTILNINIHHQYLESWDVSSHPCFPSYFENLLNDKRKQLRVPWLGWSLGLPLLWSYYLVFLRLLDTDTLISRSKQF